MTHIMAIANQKGGVGKTTTAINLSTALAAIGKKVLLMDLDPQGNATTGLGINESSINLTTYELLINSISLDDVSRETNIPNLYLAPASQDLYGIELQMVNFKKREYRLKHSIETMTKIYDYIIMDCPPALGLLTLNSLVAANEIFIPLQCEFFALEGLSQLVTTIQRVKSRFNSSLKLNGIVLTMFDRRSGLSHQVAEDVKNHFGSMVYSTIIPRNVRVSEAPSHGKPVLLYDMKCAGSQAYMYLAGEMIKRHEQSLV